jgi:hypothetical protein
MLSKVESLKRIESRLDKMIEQFNVLHNYMKIILVSDNLYDNKKDNR